MKLSEVQEDVKAILSSAIRRDEALDNTSFYSNNGLDAIDDSSVISNRQRLNDTHAPSGVGKHLPASGNSLLKPQEHYISEAMRNQHLRNQSKANADLADELDI